MEFEAVFRRFYEDNVGGKGASFVGSDTLGNLGFGASDLARLRVVLSTDLDAATSVEELAKRVGRRRLGGQEAEKVEKDRLAREQLARDQLARDRESSGCGARSEAMFVRMMRADLGKEELARSTLLATLDRATLLSAVRKRWPGTSLPLSPDATVGGLMRHLMKESGEFREWERANGPRGG